MNIFLIIIVSALFLDYLIQSLAKYLNVKAIDTKLPEEFRGIYSNDKYAHSQEYLKENTRFSVITATFSLAVTLLMVLLGGFNWLDLWVRQYEFSPLITGLVFFATLAFLQDVLTTPFSIYQTFVIEEKYGFNKTTWHTFITDKMKGYLLLAIIGGCLLYMVLYFFETAGPQGWLYVWAIMAGFSIIIQPLFTTFIAPLFNKFTPLEDGELKTAINKYAEDIKFPIARVDVMDGSRRSSKANAYFSGLGKTKRIALFDTLIKDHSTNELLSILAHEVGHYKRKHIIKGIAFSIISSGIMLFVLSKFLNNPELFAAFKMDHLSLYASLIFFSLLYNPVSMLLSLVGNAMSRKHEFEADSFARETIGTGSYLIKGLKKLTVSNLGNLNPHRLLVLLQYSHPPVLERIQALEILE